MVPHRQTPEMLLQHWHRTVGCFCGKCATLCLRRCPPCRTDHTDHVAARKKAVSPQQHGGVEQTFYTFTKTRRGYERAVAAHSQALARRRRLVDLLLPCLMQLLAGAAGPSRSSSCSAASVERAAQP